MFSLDTQIKNTLEDINKEVARRFGHIGTYNVYAYPGSGGGYVATWRRGDSGYRTATLEEMLIYLNGIKTGLLGLIEMQAINIEFASQYARNTEARIRDMIS